MVLGAVTVTLSDLALQVIAGAIAAGVVGLAMQSRGYGILGDLVIGVIGAIAANFVVGYFALLDVARFGLAGEIIVAIIGATLLVVLLHLITGRRSARTAA
jgi:uncharacterized membrane protein YeaQ/YmgE (transglycosylase-associated protein family)